MFLTAYMFLFLQHLQFLKFPNLIGDKRYFVLICIYLIPNEVGHSFRLTVTCIFRWIVFSNSMFISFIELQETFVNMAICYMLYVTNYFSPETGVFYQRHERMLLGVFLKTLPYW